MAYRLAQVCKYDEDRQKAVKQWAPVNVPAAYAILLTNKYTVPTVCYGDLRFADQPYMSVRTPYYRPITRLLSVRRYLARGARWQSPQVSGYLGVWVPARSGH